jgi:hypothetical protein
MEGIARPVAGRPNQLKAEIPNPGLPALPRLAEKTDH